MKKQTKLFSILFGFILIIATLLTGCQNINADLSLIEDTFYTHTIYSESSEKVTENIVINFDVFNKTATEINSVVNSVFQICLIQKALLENEFIQKIGADETCEITNENFAVATEKRNNKIAFTIYFYTQSAWQYFNTLSGDTAQIEIIERIFDYTRIDRRDMIGAVSTLGGEQQYFGNYLKTKVFDTTNEEDSTLISSLTTTSLYAYATPYSRRNSNAPYMATYEGLYFHIWDTTNGNAECVFWYNLARVESWYILSLIIAFVTVITILIVSHFKKEPKKVIIDDIVNIESKLKTEMKSEDVLVEDENTQKIEQVQTLKEQNDGKKTTKAKTAKKVSPKKTLVKKTPTKKRIKTKDE